MEIAERQAGIIEKQLALCPAPRIRLDTSKESARLTRVRVTVDNREGTKGLKDFEWSVWFPKSVIDGGAMVIEGRLVGMVSMTTIDGIDYIQFSRIHANPIFPTLESFVGEAKTVSEELKPFRKVYWRVVCNDGKFPESERGMIELRPAE